MSAALTPHVLQGDSDSSRGGGNWLHLYDLEQGRALLKIYRRRGDALGEVLKRTFLGVVQHQQGVTAEQRCELERRRLVLWRSHGFDVPALLDAPLPEGYEASTALWLEYCEGPLLSEVLGECGCPRDERVALVERCAADLARRQGLAAEMGERDLVMKNGTVKHVLLHADRQVSFDLETGFAPSMPLREALSDELAGFARSVERASPDADRGVMREAFARGYANRPLLEELVAAGVRGGGLRRSLKRWNDRRARGDDAKVESLRRLLDSAR